MNTEAHLIKEIQTLRRQRNAVIMAHYYQRPEIQQIADHVGDSLALARLAAQTDADVIVLCGVNFMAETAKILCPDKTVLIPAPEAGCSLADSCNPVDFKKFIDTHPGHLVVSYVNTSAAVKALTDIVVTSGNARKIIDSLPKDQKIIFGPDHNLGEYINSVTGRQMILWPGACHVHDRFSLQAVIDLKKQYPDARVLVHPECRKPLQIIADTVGSTARLIEEARNSKADTFIVVTESGILHKLIQECPDKKFIPAPQQDAECQCNQCEYMKLITLQNLYTTLRDMKPQVEIDPSLAQKALRPIQRMLELS